MNEQLKLAVYMTGILKRNAPVRDGVKYPGQRGSSPNPGNLKQNGIKLAYQVLTVDGFYVEVGGVDAPYAPYTETRSRKKDWQKNSNTQFVNKLQTLGWRLK